MNIKKLTFRYLRRFGILPKLEQRINKSARNIKEKHLSYTITKVEVGKTYLIKGALNSNSELEDKKGALIALNFLDKYGKKIEIDKSQGFGWSNKVGYYKYLITSPARNYFNIFFTAPKNCRKVKLVIRNWNEKDADIFLSPGTKLSILPKDIDLVTIGLINEFNSKLANKDILSTAEIDSFINQNSKKFNLQSKLVGKIIFDEFKNSKPHLAKYFGLIYLNKNANKKLSDEVYEAIHKSGGIEDKFEFLKSLLNINFIKESSLRYIKTKEEYDNLKNGFKLKKKANKIKYKPEKKALYLLHNSMPYNTGGYATRTHGLINNIARNSDFEITAFARPGYPTDHKKYISHKLPAKLPKSVKVDHIDYAIGEQDIRRSKLTFEEYISKFSDDVVSLAKENNASIIHAASNHPNGLAAINAAKRLGVKSIYEVRGLWEVTRVSREPHWQYTDNYKLCAQLEAQALQNADASFTITEALKDLMIERGVTKEIHVVPNAVDTSKFKPIKKDTKLEKELNLTDNTIIGYVGSVVEYEGLDDLLQALRIVKNIHKVKLLIVGDGAELDNLKNLTKTLNLENDVIFTGRVPHEEVQKYISVIDVMPFPRKPYMVCEVVSPLKPFESMASKKPVIVSSCGALTEIVKHNETGLVFEKGNIKDLAEKLSIMVKEPNLRKKLAENAFKWVKAERDWKIVSSKVADIYEELYSQIKFDSRKAK